MSEQERYISIAVDMGASNIRIMAGILENGKLQHRELYRFENKICENQGHERWDMKGIITGIIKGLNLAIHEFGPEISSLGVDSWGVDFALLDAEGELIEDPVAYRDSRTEGMESLWTGMMDRKETFERTGINFYIYNTLLQLLSLKENGFPESAARILFIPCYIQYLLCGIMKNELTISSTAQMLNIDTGDWDTGILDLLQLRHELLGKPCNPGTILGKVRHPDLSPNSIDVISVCAHDTASAIAAVPFQDESSAFISTGTWCIVGVENDRPVLTEPALKEGFTNERGYGNTYRFLKNIIGLWLVQGLRSDLSENASYEDIESLARNSSSENLVVPDSKSFFNPDSMKNAFDDFFRQTGQSIPEDEGSYYKCAYDSLVYSFRYYIEMLEEMTQKQISCINLIGGGCQSEYLSLQTARICCRKVISGPVEAATIGNILVQAITLKQISSLEEARKIVSESFDVKSYSPDHSDTKSIDQGYARFLQLKKYTLRRNLYHICTRFYAQNDIDL